MAEICGLLEVRSLAIALAQELKKGDVVFLYGQLGAGKTTFAKSMIEELTDHKDATSPTFNIAQVYEGKNNIVWHFDLYRIKSFEELEYIGINEAFDSYISIVEWPEISESIMPGSAIKVYIDFEESDDKRIITILHPKDRM